MPIKRQLIFYAISRSHGFNKNAMTLLGQSTES